MKRKRIISSLLCLLLILSSLPFQLVDSSANYQNYPSAYIGNKSHFLTEVSFEREGNYSGCIKVTLFLGVEAQNIPEELRKISTFNSLIKIDASLLSPVSSAKATRGQPTLNSVIENAGASPKYNWLKRDAGNSFAIFNQEVPYLEYNEDEEEYVQKSSSFDISISSLSYNAVTNTCYCDFSGMNLSGISWSESFDKEQKTGYLPIAYLYLARLNENIELPLLRNAISLAKEEEIRAESGCLSPNILNENSISTTTEKSRFVTDSGISFTDDFYPKYDVTFKRFSDGETADDIVVPTTEGKIPEAPEVADYTKGDYLYSFISWDREITAVDSETTYTAQYSRTFMGHDYIPEITKQPDCENKGETTYICSRCGDSFCEDNIPALGHDWGDWVQTTDPDCTNEGVETRTCKRNSAHFETRPVESLGHNYVPVITPPTCTEQGFTTYTCSRCNDSYIADFTVANGHTEADPVTENNVNPTCEEQGHYDLVVYCSVCNAELLRTPVTVDALGHDWGDWVQTTDPDCTNEGVETRTCKRNSAHFETRPVEPLGHNYVPVITPPTCTEQGFTTYTCSRCNDSYIADFTVANGHTEADPVTENNVNPTCEEQGHYDLVVYCSVCNAELSRTPVTVDALSHDWGDWVQTTDPDCTNEGVETRTCKRNSAHFETRPVESLGHNYVPVITPPTCTEQGFTTYTCSRCNDSYIADFTVANGHTEADPVTENNVNPTCEEQGHYDLVVYCSVCHAELSRTPVTVDALSHDWGDWVQTTDPDCTNEGVETRTCKRNSAHFETRPVEPLGHNYVPTVIEPTVRNGGYTVYTCSRCLDSYSDDFTDRIPLYYSIPAYEGRTQTLVFINAETRIEVSTATGQFLINDLPDGSYNVFALSQNCLTRFIDNYTFSENNYVLENAATLPTGDVNHDGIIDIADISLLISEDIYGTENIEYNLCDDNTINIKDIAVILYKGNYLSVADLIK